MGTSIVVVEDDHLQAEPLRAELAAQFPDARIRTMSSESEFRAGLPELREDPPGVVVMDVMLRWARAAPDAPPRPPEVQAEDYYRAGLRCARLMAADDRLRSVPVILLTILESGDLDRSDDTPATASPPAPRPSYVRKSADFHQLVRKVRQLLGER